MNPRTMLLCSLASAGLVGLFLTLMGLVEIFLNRDTSEVFSRLHLAREIAWHLGAVGGGGLGLARPRALVRHLAQR